MIDFNNVAPALILAKNKGLSQQQAFQVALRANVMQSAFGLNRGMTVVLAQNEADRVRPPTPSPHTVRPTESSDVGVAWRALTTVLGLSDDEGADPPNQREGVAGPAVAGRQQADPLDQLVEGIVAKAAADVEVEKPPGAAELFQRLATCAARHHGNDAEAVHEQVTIWMAELADAACAADAEEDEAEVEVEAAEVPPEVAPEAKAAAAGGRRRARNPDSEA